MKRLLAALFITGALMSPGGCARHQPVIREIPRSDAADTRHEQNAVAAAQDRSGPALLYPSQNRPGMGSPED